MDEVKQVSGLIGNIYDAALDRSLWPLVLEQTCAYVEGCGSSLMSHDSAHRSGQFYFSWGDDPYYTKLYFEKYVKINPLLVPLSAAAHVGQVAAALDFVPGMNISLRDFTRSGRSRRDMSITFMRSLINLLPPLLLSS